MVISQLAFRHLDIIFYALLENKDKVEKFVTDTVLYITTTLIFWCSKQELLSWTLTAKLICLYKVKKTQPGTEFWNKCHNAKGEYCFFRSRTAWWCPSGQWPAVSRSTKHQGYIRGALQLPNRLCRSILWVLRCWLPQGPLWQRTFHTLHPLRVQWTCWLLWCWYWWDHTKRFPSIFHSIYSFKSFFRFVFLNPLVAWIIFYFPPISVLLSSSRSLHHPSSTYPLRFFFVNCT